MPYQVLQVQAMSCWWTSWYSSWVLSWPLVGELSNQVSVLACLSAALHSLGCSIHLGVQPMSSRNCEWLGNSFGWRIDFHRPLWFSALPLLDSWPHHGGWGPGVGWRSEPSAGLRPPHWRPVLPVGLCVVPRSSHTTQPLKTDQLLSLRSSLSSFLSFAFVWLYHLYLFCIFWKFLYFFLLLQFRRGSPSKCRVINLFKFLCFFKQNLLPNHKNNLCSFKGLERGGKNRPIIPFQRWQILFIRHISLYYSSNDFAYFKLDIKRKLYVLLSSYSIIIWASPISLALESVVMAVTKLILVYSILLNYAIV